MDDPVHRYLALSARLTGFHSLPESVARTHLGLLARVAELAAPLAKLLDGLETSADTTAWLEALRGMDLETRRAARVVARLWYTGDLSQTLPGEDRKLEIPGDEESVEMQLSALLWDAVGAHAPGLSGGYFGYWRYPPER